MDYYVVTHSGEEGPYDLVSIVKQIRGGKVTKETPIRLAPGGDSTPAEKVESLKEFFVEESEQPRKPGYGGLGKKSRQYDLKQVFSNSVHFLQLNQVAALYTGIYLAIAIGFIAVLPIPGIAGHIIVSCISYVLFAGYLYIILKRSRGQTFEIGQIIQGVTSHFLPLIAAGGVISVIAGIGFVLLIAPGLLALTFYIFTPLLILEKDMGFWEAMEVSRKTVLNMGTHNMGVLLALVVGNFLGAVFLFFPLLITLPITANALSEIYDEMYN